MNVILIGAGHYATGQTVLSDVRSTDKDHGVFLPAILALRSAGLVREVGIAARDGRRWISLGKKLQELEERFGWDSRVRTYPDEAQIDARAYVRALAEMPRPLAALIAVPDALHSQVMEHCIEAQVPFLIVKPAVTRLNDLYRVLGKLDERPVLAMVDYHKVFDQANVMLREEYRAGRYGKMQHATSLMTQRRDMLEIFARWFDQGASTNVNHYLGSHYIHMISHITGAEPIDVRATAQGGVAAGMLEREDVADLIETQIRWTDPHGSMFSSFHVAGWSDPRETESMTYQELHLICEAGHVDSDQRYRGSRKVLAGEGYSAPNPHFFHLTKGPRGVVGLDGMYGYQSIKTFVEVCSDIANGAVDLDSLDAALPTLHESEKVTAILEAADHSLAAGSAVIGIVRRDGKLLLR